MKVQSTPRWGAELKEKEVIKLAHGSGGKLTRELIDKLIRPKFGNRILDRLEDAAVIFFPPHLLAFSTDSYVVRPIFFPGGDIGKLAVTGTINDLAVVGAQPLVISCGFILEEGLPLATLNRIIDSMQKVACETGCEIVAGDTKVVEKGAADQIFINTTGLGLIRTKSSLSIERIKPGDQIIVTGTIGDHAAAVFVARQNLPVKTSLISDCASLYRLLESLWNLGEKIRFMRDPTRGGIAATLNEIANRRNFGIEIVEETLPIQPEVKGICELMGFDPLHLANEGKAIIVASPESVEIVLSLLKQHPLGKNSSVIGRIVENPLGLVYMKTNLGTKRIIDLPVGDPLPRIC
ncbi:MAG: Hydrogenase expression/formation protein HypE [candidate division Zixibacteria bacterium RBG-1]|nr:MAG: Hydrogenase expression/formation protein HypE [candidate division Zixibacteria bacterium RBG-1]OGC83819.1 MAG: hydrogenase expression/formation protein HypE [candidate division Zixibacteria bacterium RBG_19FT_COMBO_42_43]